MSVCVCVRVCERVSMCVCLGGSVCVWDTRACVLATCLVACVSSRKVTVTVPTGVHLRL